MQIKMECAKDCLKLPCLIDNRAFHANLTIFKMGNVWICAKFVVIQPSELQLVMCGYVLNLLTFSPVN
jgi:hypothetical protein